MAFFEEFLDMMPYEDITLHQNAGYNQAGDLQEGADLVVQGYIDGKAQKVVNSDGVEVMSQNAVYLATIVSITPETLVTLPQGYHPRSRLPILSVDRLSDEDGATAMVLHV